MPFKYLNKDYIIYGSSIVISRGLEYLVLFYAAYYMPKSDYGELEFYKKVIEVGSSVFAFGFPALILSYTRSNASKANFFLLSILFVGFLGIISGIFLAFTPWLFLLIPFVFYALFFTGGITHSYFLVKQGSSFASMFKIAVSTLFYIVVFCSIYFFEVKGNAFVYVNYILIGPLILFIVTELKKQQFVIYQLKKYWKLFKRLLFSSFTLVISNFANLMFLYTDVFVIKLLSKSANIEIANYSFALNIAALLLLIPMTLVQVDIEKLKSNRAYVRILNKKIFVLTFAAAILLILLFFLLTEIILLNYRGVFYLFILILAAKIVQAFSPLYGTMIVVEKRFRLNLYINIVALVLNIFISSALYYLFGVYGVALASIIMLLARYITLNYSYSKIIRDVSINQK